MVGQELLEHLNHIQKLLSTLKISLHEYQSREKPTGQKNISLSIHMVYMIGLIVIILILTYIIGLFLGEAQRYIHYIGLLQIILTVGTYLTFIRFFNQPKNLKQDPPKKFTDNGMSVYELDKLRFTVLQELAASPIPPEYLSQTCINKMIKLVSSGMCISIEECIKSLGKEKDSKQHMKEVEFIRKMQISSYV
ncbi:hypothetical protein [Bacillus weihaiensis]|uniref:Uncharacterized protein n=1 Tax=Bacillus weihaiensis TaxID=1547283 RepID=A0A1L3MMK4_9BACI|nr:hypothetical protein [Bacillus weihaiensis]APH03551.1 hypothetical protein A9C19_01610 [Bacillus weihaiensis]